jgi:hypothetical protein
MKDGMSKAESKKNDKYPDGTPGLAHTFSGKYFG